MIQRLAISGYRSLRDVTLPLGQLTVITGANGSGKSSVYRALRLLADVAQGRVVASLAAEGGFASTLWAGPEKFSRDMKLGVQPVQGTRREGPIALRLGFSGDDYGYAIDLGLPSPSLSMFSSDAEIKTEAIWTGRIHGRSNMFADRRGPLVRLRDAEGVWRTAFDQLSYFDSMLSHLANPTDAFELLLLRERMRGWRFYDNLRTDRDAPARRPQIGTYTPVLAGDGADLAAAIQTIVEIGDGDALKETVADAFAGAWLTIGHSGGFVLEMHQPGLLRPLAAAELSDGTLRYLLLVAALLSPRPPALMVLNEPESSLHPDLLAPLARLIAHASARSQIVVVSHAAGLVAALAGQLDCVALDLTKELGETVAADVDAPSWTWPQR